VSTFFIAAKRADWDIMKWLYDIHCPWDSKTFRAAIDTCDMNILLWLKRNNCPWGKDVSLAAIVKDVFVFERTVWLRVEGCPWSSSIFDYAIMRGLNHSTLKWFLHEDSNLIS
jgi:hypothetical protein